MDFYNCGDYTETKDFSKAAKFGDNQFKNEEIDELIVKLVETSRGVNNQKIDNQTFVKVFKTSV